MEVNDVSISSDDIKIDIDEVIEDPVMCESCL